MRTARARDVAADLAGLGIAAAALLLLAARPFMTSLAGTTRGVSFAVLFASIGVASLVVPVRRDHAQLNPLLVGAIGLGAIVAGMRAAGAAPPLAIGAWTVPLTVLAAVAEEALFRRLAYAELARFGVALAVGGSALLFALVHLPVYGAASFPLDLGAGLLLSWQRWASGTWSVPAATHAAANLLAVIR